VRGDGGEGLVRPGHRGDLLTEAGRGGREPRLVEHADERGADRAGLDRVGLEDERGAGAAARLGVEVLLGAVRSRTCGTPWASAPSMVPAPAWAMTARQPGSTSDCGI
jgi:hypothetical protein